MHKNTPSVHYNLWLKHLDIQLNKPTDQNSIKAPKVVKPMKNYKTLRTSVINSMTPPSLVLLVYSLECVSFFLLFYKCLYVQRKGKENIREGKVKGQ